MASNLFGQPSTNDIKVGYIDPQLGYVDGVTICEANEYAQKNPGTTFLFKNGNQVLKYLNINEVNGLTPTDLESNKNCEGINQKKECGPPTIQIYGGGGIGAVGNPVIGLDGALLAVDLVRGGHGYQYPPQVSANDDCNYGSGAVLTAILGEIVDGVETYDTEEDFEEYDICDPNEVGYGKRYGPNGEDLGPWEPIAYTKIGVDPIKQEIQKYERGVRASARIPFWTTRQNRPNKITSSDSKIITSTTKYDVTFPAWSQFMNSYAVSPVPSSNVRGSDFAGTLFSMEWNIDFPTTGEYLFRGLCDNVSTLYIDNVKVSDLKHVTLILQSNPEDVLKSVRDVPNAVKATISEGVHNVRVDLLNVPIMETVVEQSQSQTTEEQPAGSLFIKEGNNYYILVGGNDLVEIQFSFEWNDSPNIAGYAATKIIIPSEKDGPVILKRPLTGETGSVKSSGIFKNGKKYGPIVFEGAAKNAKSPVIVNTGPSPNQKSQRINLFDGSGDDVNAKLTTINAKQLSPSRVISNPLPTSETGKVTRVFNTVDYIDKANRKLWRTNVYGRGGFLNQYGVCPFDTTKQLDNNPYAGTHRIIWDNIDFPVDGSYNIDVEVDDNATLTFIRSGTNESTTVVKKGFSSPGKGSGKTTESRFFKSGKYKIIVDLEQIPGGKFAFNAIKGINPMALAVDIQVTSTTKTVVSPKSWNENPMGVALTIDAPEPSVPQEPVPEQEGRCPNNPIWTTRFPPSTEKWFPVNFPGPRTITETITSNVPVPTNDKVEVEFSVYGEGGFRDLSFIFTAVDGSHTFTLYGVDKNKKTRKDKVKITPNLKYVVAAKEDSSKYNSVEQGIIKGGTKAKEQGIGTSNKIFADYIGTANDNDDMQVTASAGTFTSSNMRKARNGGRNTYDLTYTLTAAPGTKNLTTTSTRTYDAPGWSRFMNRYAISPVKPLDLPGSDKSGVTYSTSWDIDLPYEGFYGIKGTRDNTGRILIDGVEVSKLDNFNVESPKMEKKFLTRGRHTITAEVFNTPVINESVINQVIFRTKDWQVPLNQKEEVQPAGGNFIKKGSDYYLMVGGNDLIGLTFTLSYDDSPFIAGTAVTKVTIPSDNGKVVIERKKIGSTVQESGSVTVKGTFRANQTYGPIIFEGRSLRSKDPEIVDTGNPKKDPGTFQQRINFFDGDGSDINASLALIPPPDQKSGPRITDSITEQPTTKNGVSYVGPKLFHYTDKRWGSFMNDQSVSPYLPPLNSPNPEINGKKTYTWSGVKFPESGQYNIAFNSDNVGELYIGGQKVLTTTNFLGEIYYQQVNITAGTYDVVVYIENVKDTTDIFYNNPVGFAIEIRKEITLREQNQTPWSSNPMGISAVLVPPPCPKKLSGRGVVTKIDIQDPGNGYTPSGTPSSYPVALELDGVIVADPGINYNCGVDVIKITPSNGAVLDYECDPYGKIKKVIVVNPGFGFTTYPEITIGPPDGIGPNGLPIEPTGINATFIPQFRVVRDPIVRVPEKLIQVTDLVGLKQNGYVAGRSYYGAVFYKNNIRYAGFYETPGDLVQVYDTLQESIDAQVTTPPSAIERSGTDTNLSSNNPKLNIPGTPENLI